MALCRREQWLLLPVQELCRSWTLSLYSQTAAFISRARNAIYRTPPSASHVITPGYLLEGVTEVLWESFSWLWRELRWFRDLFLSSCFSWASNEQQPVMHWCSVFMADVLIRLSDNSSGRVILWWSGVLTWVLRCLPKFSLELQISVEISWFLLRCALTQLGEYYNS